MKRYRIIALMLSLLLIVATQALAQDTPEDVLKKAIEAVGGADKLGEAKAYSWTTKGKVTFNDMESDFTGETLIQDINHLATKFKTDFGGMEIEGGTVIDGDKGWRTFGMKMALEGEALAMEKRNLYLLVAPFLPTILQEEGFELKGTGESKVDGKTATRLKVTGPDGKDFTLFFDPESGLPIKLSAEVAGFMGGEAKQEVMFSEYKDFDGIKKATKIVQTMDGAKFLEQEISDFKVLDEVPANAFAEPK